MPTKNVFRKKNGDDRMPPISPMQALVYRSQRDFIRKIAEQMSISTMAAAASKPVVTLSIEMKRKKVFVVASTLFRGRQVSRTAFSLRQLNSLTARKFLDRISNDFHRNLYSGFRRV